MLPYKLSFPSGTMVARSRLGPPIKASSAPLYLASCDHSSLICPEKGVLGGLAVVEAQALSVPCRSSVESSSSPDLGISR